MYISEGILFGIFSMLVWGLVDFLIAIAVRKSEVLRMFFWTQLIEIALYIFAFFLFFEMPSLSASDAFLILASGFLSTISWLAFYKSLKIGKISIATPISSAWPAVTVAISILFLGESLSKTEALGVMLAIAGTVLASFKLKELMALDLKNPALGVKHALLSMASWGVTFVFIGMLVAKLGWFVPLFLIKAAGLGYLGAYSGITRRRLSFPKTIVLFIGAISTLEVAGFLSYGVSLTTEHTSIVAPIIASSPAITIALARIFLRETIDFNQKTGIVSILLGLVLLSV